MYLYILYVAFRCRYYKFSLFTFPFLHFFSRSFIFWVRVCFCVPTIFTNEINFRLVCEFMCKCCSACVCSMLANTHSHAFQKGSLALILSLFVCILLPLVHLLSHDAITSHPILSKVDVLCSSETILEMLRFYFSYISTFFSISV